MEIIIIPFLLGIVVIGVIAIVKSIKLLKLKIIKGKELVYGLLISISLFGLICLIYILEGQAWVFSPAFRIPFFMIFMPFVTHLLAQKNENPQVEYASKLLLISVAFTVVLSAISYPFLIDLIGHLGVQESY